MLAGATHTEKRYFHMIACAQAHKLMHFIQAMDYMEAAPCNALRNTRLRSGGS